MSVSERAALRVGTLVQQKYRIDRLIGIGGMAAVYAATHRNGHRVAIKFILDRFSDDPEVCRLFSREAYVANQVGHPGAVPVLDDDVDDEGCAFLIMPLLEGETLRARWERANKRLPLAEVAVLMADVLDVLARAHANGIVHRDIKPENLFLTAAGDVRVLDFGIARRIDGEGSATATGRMIGTPAFMPPEQALGNRIAIGPHSDCWGVGATMFSLLSGEPVHIADSGSALLVAAATKHARSLAEVMPDLPSAVVRFVDKALAFDPVDRWRAGREMRHALVEMIDGGLGESFPTLATRVRAELVAELAPKSEASRLLERKISNGSSHDESAHAPTELLVPEDRPPPTRPSGKSETGATDMAGVAAAGGTKGRRVRSATFVSIAAVMLVGAIFAGVYGLKANRRVEAPSAAPVEEDATAPLSGNPEALSQIHAGIQHWRDASERTAEKSFARAIELDPSSAAAHLYACMIPTWTDDETRAHHHAASAQRSQLRPRDRALLEAYAPAMAMPPDLESSAQRLRAAREMFPSDWLVAYALADTQIKRDKLREGIEILDDLLRKDPSLAVALADKGLAFASLDDVKSARDSLNECLRLSPYGDTCLRLLVQLDASEGRCADAERHARMLMAVPSPMDWSATQLAGAIQGRGGAMESVHDVLGQAWQLAPAPKREIVRLQNETRFHLLGGAFGSAQRAVDVWSKALAGVRYEDNHASLAKLRFHMAMELGDPPLAARLASEYLAKRDAWLASTYYDWEILPLVVQYRAGGLSRDAFRKRREAWLTRQAAGEELVSALNQRWTFAYALAAVTRDDAIDALAELPKYLPITVAISRDVQLDDGIGTVYLLAGEIEKALPYLRRGASSCNAIQFPFEHTWAHLHLGMALEQMADTRGACAAYDVVLTRWGKEPRSVSAKTARARRAALHCPAAGP